MPQWTAYVVGTAVLIAAIGTIWTKVVHPLIKFTKTADEMVGVLRDLTVTFKDTPHAFDVLEEIVGQFRTDSGSSLRDAVDRLDRAAEVQARAADALRVRSLATSDLAADDRVQLAHVLAQLELVASRVTANTSAVGAVVDDLAAGHARADEAGDAPGESADAAAMSPTDPPTGALP